MRAAIFCAGPVAGRYDVRRKLRQRRAISTTPPQKPIWCLDHISTPPSTAPPAVRRQPSPSARMSRSAPRRPGLGGQGCQRQHKALFLRRLLAKALKTLRRLDDLSGRDQQNSTRIAPLVINAALSRAPQRTVAAVARRRADACSTSSPTVCNGMNVRCDLSLLVGPRVYTDFVESSAQSLRALAEQPACAQAVRKH